MEERGEEEKREEKGEEGKGYNINKLTILSALHTHTSYAIGRRT